MLEPPPYPSPTVVLRPSRAAAAAWTGAGMLALAAGVYLAVDSRGHPLAVAFALLAAAATAVFAAQLLRPDLSTVHLGQHGLRGRLLGRPVTVPWQRVYLARVRSIAGDPVLDLVLTDPPGRAVLPLPVGADLAALHAFLGARLGRGGTPQAPPARMWA